jgi:nucleotide-binding universal stress UspA family protein
MWRRILVPVDFSLRSPAALSFAVDLARQHAAEIELLHVVPAAGRLSVVFDAWSGRPMPHAPESVVLDAREKLESLLSSVDHRAVTVHQKIDEGDPAATIVRLAAEDGADLIVLGARGHDHFLRGSVAARLWGCAPCPVLTLRA